MIDYPFTVPANNPNEKGKVAGRKLIFGAFNRYALYPVHSREIAGESVLGWFIADAEQVDKFGCMKIVCIETSLENALIVANRLGE